MRSRRSGVAEDAADGGAVGHEHGAVRRERGKGGRQSPVASDQSAVTSHLGTHSPCHRVTPNGGSS